MMTGLAHESGNALARSQACLEMLGLEVQDRPEALELLGRVQKAQDHLQQLYDEVRNYAAPLRRERVFWPLEQVWRQAWNNLAVRRAGRTATLHEELGGIDTHCWIDPSGWKRAPRAPPETVSAGPPLGKGRRRGGRGWEGGYSMAA